MRIVYQNVAGLDVHKKVVVAAIIVQQSGRELASRKAQFWDHDREFAGALGLVARSRRDPRGDGKHGRILEARLQHSGERILRSSWSMPSMSAKCLGARPIKVMRNGLAELMQYGLLKASFIPPLGQRELRELTRYRSSFVRERSNLMNRVQKVLESANIKLGSVVSDIMGVSSRSMLEAIIDGQASPAEMAELAKGRMREKREALTKALEGRVKAHHRFVLTELLCQIDSLEETIARFDQEIEDYCRPFEAAGDLTRYDPRHRPTHG